MEQGTFSIENVRGHRKSATT